jgi:hypothetical protein
MRPVRPIMKSTVPETQLAESDFSVRIRTRYGIFIFGFNVGKTGEHWRIAAEQKNYSTEAEAIDVLRRRKTLKKKTAA